MPKTKPFLSPKYSFQSAARTARFFGKSSFSPMWGIYLVPLGWQFIPKDGYENEGGTVSQLQKSLERKRKVPTPVANSQERLGNIRKTKKIAISNFQPTGPLRPLHKKLRMPPLSSLSRPAPDESTIDIGVGAVDAAVRSLAERLANLHTSPHNVG